MALLSERTEDEIVQFAKEQGVSFIGIQFGDGYTTFKYVLNKGVPYALYLDRLLEDNVFDVAVGKIGACNMDQVDHGKMSPIPARETVRQNLLRSNGGATCYDTGFD